MIIRRKPLGFQNLRSPRSLGMRILRDSIQRIATRTVQRMNPPGEAFDSAAAYEDIYAEDDSLTNEAAEFGADGYAIDGDGYDDAFQSAIQNAEAPDPNARPARQAGRTQRTVQRTPGPQRGTPPPAKRGTPARPSKPAGQPVQRQAAPPPPPGSFRRQQLTEGDTMPRDLSSIMNIHRERAANPQPDAPTISAFSTGSGIFAAPANETRPATRSAASKTSGQSTPVQRSATGKAADFADSVEEAPAPRSRRRVQVTDITPPKKGLPFGEDPVDFPTSASPLGAPIQREIQNAENLPERPAPLPVNRNREPGTRGSIHRESETDSGGDEEPGGAGQPYTASTETYAPRRPVADAVQPFRDDTPAPDTPEFTPVPFTTPDQNDSDYSENVAPFNAEQTLVDYDVADMQAAIQTAEGPTPANYLGDSGDQTTSRPTVMDSAPKATASASAAQTVQATRRTPTSETGSIEPPPTAPQMSVSPTSAPPTVQRVQRAPADPITNRSNAAELKPFSVETAADVGDADVYDEGDAPDAFNPPGEMFEGSLETGRASTTDVMRSFEPAAADYDDTVTDYAEPTEPDFNDDASGYQDAFQAAIRSAEGPAQTGDGGSTPIATATSSGARSASSSAGSVQRSPSDSARTGQQTQPAPRAVPPVMPSAPSGGTSGATVQRASQPTSAPNISAPPPPGPVAQPAIGEDQGGFDAPDVESPVDPLAVTPFLLQRSRAPQVQRYSEPQITSNTLPEWTMDDEAVPFSSDSSASAEIADAGYTDSAEFSDSEPFSEPPAALPATADQRVQRSFVPSPTAEASTNDESASTEWFGTEAGESQVGWAAQDTDGGFSPGAEFNAASGDSATGSDESRDYQSAFEAAIRSAEGPTPTIDGPSSATPSARRTSTGNTPASNASTGSSAVSGRAQRSPRSAPPRQTVQRTVQTPNTQYATRYSDAAAGESTQAPTPGSAPKQPARSVIQRTLQASHLALNNSIRAVNRRFDPVQARAVEYVQPDAGYTAAYDPNTAYDSNADFNTYATTEYSAAYPSNYENAADDGAVGDAPDGGDFNASVAYSPGRTATPGQVARAYQTSQADDIEPDPYQAERWDSADVDVESDELPVNEMDLAQALGLTDSAPDYSAYRNTQSDMATSHYRNAPGAVQRSYNDSQSATEDDDSDDAPYPGWMETDDAAESGSYLTPPSVVENDLLGMIGLPPGTPIARGGQVREFNNSGTDTADGGSVQRSVDSDSSGRKVRREVQGGQQMNMAQADDGSDDPQGTLDDPKTQQRTEQVEKLAQAVYQIIKQRLKVERERQFGKR